MPPIYKGMHIRDEKRDAILIRLAGLCIHARSPWPTEAVLCAGLGVGVCVVRRVVGRLEDEGRLVFARYGRRKWPVPTNKNIVELLVESGTE